MRVKATAFVILLLFIVDGLVAQVIPSTNTVDWSKAGNSYIFPANASQVSILSFGGIADGIADNYTALHNAMASFGGHPGIVYFPPGAYLFSTTVEVPDSICLKGAGSDSTFIKLAHSSNGFNFTGSATGSFTDIISGFQKGSHKIKVTDSSLLQRGNYCEIRQDNGAWDSNPASWALYCVGQIVQIDSIKNDTLVLYDDLHITFDTSLNLQIQKINPLTASGISCMNVERTDNSTSGTGYNFQFLFAVNCELRGVEGNKSQGSHCMIDFSSHISVDGCYFHDAFVYDGSGTKGYGVTLIDHSSLCLIQNNVFNHLRHSMMTKQGANGNVFAYNYSRNPFRNGSLEYPQDYCGDIALHGHYSFANLFEGNIVQTIYIDQTWGPSGPYNTFFRNRAEQYGIIMTSAQTNNQNFVGNEITGTGYTFPITWGAYTITGSGHIQYGNNKNGVITPAGTSPLADISYFLNSAPAYWNVSQSWPDIGIPNALNSGELPAKNRYNSSQLTDCSQQNIITQIAANEQNDIMIFPNPVSDKLHIQLNGENKGITIQIKTPEGKSIISISVKEGISGEDIDLSCLMPGIYLLVVKTANNSCIRKIVKL
jgi:hypothetical protein